MVLDATRSLGDHSGAHGAKINPLIVTRYGRTDHCVRDRRHTASWREAGVAIAGKDEPAARGHSTYTTSASVSLRCNSCSMMDVTSMSRASARLSLIFSCIGGSAGMLIDVFGWRVAFFVPGGLSILTGAAARGERLA